jgi:hypothetical protein
MLLILSHRNTYLCLDFEWLILGLPITPAGNDQVPAANNRPFAPALKRRSGLNILCVASLGCSGNFRSWK